MNPNSADELVRFANSKKKEGKQNVADINDSDALLNALGLKKKDTGTSVTLSPVSGTTSTTDVQPDTAPTGQSPATDVSEAPTTPSLGLGSAAQAAGNVIAGVLPKPIVNGTVDLDNNFQQDSPAVFGTIGGQKIDLRQAGPQNVSENVRNFQAQMLQERLKNKTLTKADAALLSGVTGLAPNEVNLAVNQPEVFKKYSDITSRINNAETKLEDVDYLAKNFPELTKNLIKSIAPDLAGATDLNGETLSVFSDRLNEYAQGKINEQKAGSASQQDVLFKQRLNSQGIDPNKLSDSKYVAEVNGKVNIDKGNAMSLLERKYPMRSGSAGVGGVYTYRDNQQAYEEEKAAIETRFAETNYILGTSAANDFAKKNPSATPIEVGLEYLKVADPDRYKLIQKSQETNRNIFQTVQAVADAAAGRKSTPFITRSNTSLDRDLAQIGANALYATGDPGIAKLVNRDEKDFDMLYPEKKTADIYRRLGAELYKGQNLVANITPSLNRIDEAAKKALSDRDYQFYVERVRPLEEKSIGTRIPVSGAVNKAAEAIGTAGFDFGNFLSDKLVPASMGGRTESDQALDQLQQGDNTRMEDIGENGANKAELASLVAKQKTGSLSAAEQARKRDLQSYTGVRSTATKFIDGTAGVTGQVIFQGLLTKGLGSVAAGVVKSAGLLKAEQLVAGLGTEETIANAATNFGISREAIQTAAANFTAYGVSYDQAARQALELFPDDEDSGKRALHANTVALINMASENIFRDDKALDVFRRQIAPDVANLVNRLSVENLTKKAFQNEIKGIVLEGLKLGGTILKENSKETLEEVATSLGTSVTTAVLAPAKFNAKEAYDDAVNTATTMFTNGFLVAGMAGVKHARVNHVGIPMLSQLGVNQQFTSGVINEINRQSIKGIITDEEAAEKIKIVNDAIQINKNEMQQADAIALPERARGKYFVKRLHEKELARQAERSTDPVQQQTLQAEAADSQEVRQGILDGAIEVDDNYVPQPVVAGAVASIPEETTQPAVTPGEAAASTPTPSPEIQALQAESDALLDKGVDQFSFRREELKNQGKNRDEIQSITYNEWLVTPDGKRYQEIEDKIKTATTTQPSPTPGEAAKPSPTKKQTLAERLRRQADAMGVEETENNETTTQQTVADAANISVGDTNDAAANTKVSAVQPGVEASPVVENNEVVGSVVENQLDPVLPPATAAAEPSYTETPVTPSNIKNLKPGDSVYQKDGKKFTIKKINGSRIETNEGLTGSVSFLDVFTRTPTPASTEKELAKNSDLAREILDENPDAVTLAEKDNIHQAINDYEGGKITGEDLYKSMLSNGLDKKYIIPSLIQKLSPTNPTPGDSRQNTPQPSDEAQQTPQENSQAQGSDVVLENSEASAVVDDTGKDKKPAAGEELTDDTPIAEEAVKTNKAAAKKAADKIRKAADKIGNTKLGGEGTAMLDITAIPRKIIQGALYGAAEIIERGGETIEAIAEAISHVVDTVKKHYAETGIDATDSEITSSVENYFVESGLLEQDELPARDNATDSNTGDGGEVVGEVAAADAGVNTGPIQGRRGVTDELLRQSTLDALSLGRNEQEIVDRQPLDKRQKVIVDKIISDYNAAKKAVADVIKSLRKTTADGLAISDTAVTLLPYILRDKALQNELKENFYSYTPQTFEEAKAYATNVIKTLGADGTMQVLESQTGAEQQIPIIHKLAAYSELAKQFNTEGKYQQEANALMAIRRIGTQSAQGLSGIKLAKQLLGLSSGDARVEYYNKLVEEINNGLLAQHEGELSVMQAQVAELRKKLQTSLSANDTLKNKLAEAIAGAVNGEQQQPKGPKEKAKKIVNRLNALSANIRNSTKGMTFSSVVPISPAIVADAIDLVATLVEAGGNVIDAIQKGIDQIKSKVANFQDEDKFRELILKNTFPKQYEEQTERKRGKVLSSEILNSEYFKDNFQNTIDGVTQNGKSVADSVKDNFGFLPEKIQNTIAGQIETEIKKRADEEVKAITDVAKARAGKNIYQQYAEGIVNGDEVAQLLAKQKKVPFITTAQAQQVTSFIQQANKLSGFRAAERLERANVIIDLANGGVWQHIISTAVFMKALISYSFATGSLLSNRGAQLSDALGLVFSKGLTPGETIKLLTNKDLRDYARSINYDVLYRGGIGFAETAAYIDNESKKARLEEYKLGKTGFLLPPKLMAALGSRIANAPDSARAASITVQNMVVYAKEAVRIDAASKGLQLTNKEVSDQAMAMVFSKTRQEAASQAEAEFLAEGKQLVGTMPGAGFFEQSKLQGAAVTRGTLGQVIDRRSTEFTRRVGEIIFERIEQQQADRWQAAVANSQNKLFKADIGWDLSNPNQYKGQNAFVKFVSAPLGGLVATATRTAAGLASRGYKALDSVTSDGKKTVFQTVGSAINLFAFGFPKGAANFVETYLDSHPLYVAGKIAAMQVAKYVGTQTPESRKEISRQQGEAVARGIMAVVKIGVLKAAVGLLQQAGACKDGIKVEVKNTTDANSKDGNVSICGQAIPVWLTGGTQFNGILNSWARMQDQPGWSDQSKTGLDWLMAYVIAEGQDIFAAGFKGQTTRSETEYPSFLRQLIENSNKDSKLPDEVQTRLTENFWLNTATGLLSNMVMVPQSAIKQSVRYGQYWFGDSNVYYKKTFEDSNSGRLQSIMDRFTAGMLYKTGLGDIFAAAELMGKPALDYRGRQINEDLKLDAYDEKLRPYNVYMGFSRNTMYVKQKDGNVDAVFSDEEYYKYFQDCSTQFNKWVGEHADKLDSDFEAYKKKAGGKDKQDWAAQKINSAMSDIKKKVRKSMGSIEPK